LYFSTLSIISFGIEHPKTSGSFSRCAYREIGKIPGIIGTFILAFSASSINLK